MKKIRKELIADGLQFRRYTSLAEVFDDVTARDPRMTVGEALARIDELVEINSFARFICNEWETAEGKTTH
jgi:hypothetical protein